MPFEGNKIRLSLDPEYVAEVLHTIATCVLDCELPANIRLSVHVEVFPKFYDQPIIVTKMTDERSEPGVSEIRVWPLTDLMKERRQHASDPLASDRDFSE